MVHEKHTSNSGAVVYQDEEPMMISKGKIRGKTPCIKMNPGKSVEFSRISRKKLSSCRFSKFTEFYSTVSRYSESNFETSISRLEEMMAPFLT